MRKLTARRVTTLVGVASLLMLSFVPSGKANENPCTIKGTPGDDVIRGTPGADSICGLGGDDTIYGLRGGDGIDGGSGRDTFAADPRDSVAGVEHEEFCAAE